MENDSVIFARGLRKSYGPLEAVKGIDFEVQRGRGLRLLGPNGAGKTTTVEILEGLRPRSGGEVQGARVRSRPAKAGLKDRIGVCLQATNLPDKIKVHEALELFASFYSRQVDGDALLHRLQLWEKREAGYATLSGGQKQRLALALALINDPQMLFLDEPTTGLDPQVRLEIRDLIEELRAEKRTILMTTHYIEEAERLCDRVAIIDDGVIIAIGSPRGVAGEKRDPVEHRDFVRPTAPAGRIAAWPDAIRTIVSDDRRKISVSSSRPPKTLVELIKWIDAQGLELDDVHLNRPTLEDVFIELTGKRLRD